MESSGAGHRAGRGARLLVLVTIAFAGALPAADASAALTTEPLSATLTPENLANSLVGAGVSISNVTYTGANGAAGRFAGGTGIIGFEGGIALSSGAIANVVGPNVADSKSTGNGTPGDADLNGLLTGLTTNDAAVLEFDFVPIGSTVSFKYVFASDEYNEYVNSSFNDVFAFFVNGVNCATVGADPVSINTINNGNPFGSGTISHPELYRNNDLQDGGGSIDTEMDGLTVVLDCQASVNSGVTNRMKLAIADTTDSAYDTNVFLQAGSLTTAKTTSTTYGGDASVQYSDAVALSGTLLDTSVSPSAGLAGKQLGFTLGTQSTTAGPTSSSGNASTSLVVNQEPGTVSSVTTSFAGDATFAASNDNDPFTITKEDCTLTYSGATTVPSGTMADLAAALGEPDASPGERSGKTVTFNVTDSASNVQSFSVTTGTGGSAQTSAALAPGVYTVSASFAGDAFYNACNSPDTLVTVEGTQPPPSGPGCNVEGEGEIEAANGDEAKFEVDVESGAGPKGKVRYKDRGPAESFKLRSTEITEVVVSPDGREASIRGKATVNGAGSVDFQVELSDLPNAPDSFRIRLNDGYDSGVQSIDEGDVDFECGCEVDADGEIEAANGDEASFRVGVESIPAEGKVRYRDGGPAETLKLRSTEITEVAVDADGRQASIHGKATVNGSGSVDFDVDLRDVPGAPDTFRIRLSDAYDSGEQEIGDGDVDIECAVDD